MSASTASSSFAVLARSSTTKGWCAQPERCALCGCLAYSAPPNPGLAPRLSPRAADDRLPPRVPRSADRHLGRPQRHPGPHAAARALRAGRAARRLVGFALHPAPTYIGTHRVLAMGPWDPAGYPETLDPGGSGYGGGPPLRVPNQPSTRRWRTMPRPPTSEWENKNGLARMLRHGTWVIASDSRKVSRGPWCANRFSSQAKHS